MKISAHQVAEFFKTSDMLLKKIREKTDVCILDVEVDYKPCRGRICVVAPVMCLRVVWIPKCPKWLDHWFPVKYMQRWELSLFRVILWEGGKSFMLYNTTNFKMNFKICAGNTVGDRRRVSHFMLTAFWGFLITLNLTPSLTSLWSIVDI